MNILVTGAKGFVGRGLLPLLAAEGHTGIATGRTVPADLPPGWIGAACDRVLGDAAEIPRPDGIIHLEVKQHVPRPTAADVDEFDRVNVGGTRAWLDWAGRHGVGRFAFASSIKAVAPSTQPQFEDAPLEPDTPYGLSKARADAPAPRHVPAFAARLLAPVGDLVSGLTGRDMPLTSARLKAIEETSVFPCDKLVAAGFQHPQTTREGLAEMIGM